MINAVLLDPNVTITGTPKTGGKVLVYSFTAKKSGDYSNSIETFNSQYCSSPAIPPSIADMELILREWGNEVQTGITWTSESSGSGAGASYTLFDWNEGIPIFTSDPNEKYTAICIAYY